MQQQCAQTGGAWVANPPHCQLPQAPPTPAPTETTGAEDLTAGDEDTANDNPPRVGFATFSFDDFKGNLKKFGFGDSSANDLIGKVRPAIERAQRMQVPGAPKEKSLFEQVGDFLGGIIQGVTQFIGQVAQLPGQALQAMTGKVVLSNGQAVAQTGAGSAAGFGSLLVVAFVAVAYNIFTYIRRQS